MKTPNQKIISHDILKYKTNKLASTLALLGIVFNVLYFCMLYSFTNEFFSTWKIGISVVLTLLTLLATFLASEGIKNYNKKFGIVLLVLAVIQIVRIFGLPLEALRHDIELGVENELVGGALTGGYFFKGIIPSVAYTVMVIWLVLSAAALIASAVIGYINSARLESYNQKVNSGEINIDDTLREMDEEDERQAANVLSEANVTENELKLVEEDEKCLK